MEKLRNQRTIKLIKLYQKHKRISGRCHFIPSCSNYAIMAYQKFNWFYASILTGFRILRCHPFAKRKVDLVPLSKEEKRKKLILDTIKKQNDAFFIDTILKHTHMYQMEDVDYVILTLEYLYGLNLFDGISEYNHIEYLGKEFIRCNYHQMGKILPIDELLTKKYLNILTTLAKHNFIQFTNSIDTFENLNHSLTFSQNYDTNYHVCHIRSLPLSFWENEIEKYFSDKTIIGFENITQDTLMYFQKKWEACIIDSKKLNHKLIHSIPNKVIILIGDNLTNPHTSYFLNCLVRFYDIEESFDINKYTIIIPKQKELNRTNSI